MATPFQERSPCQTASYPRLRSASTGNAPCSALSSWRQTTSGPALANHSKRLSNRLLMSLILNVATFTSPAYRIERIVCPNNFQRNQPTIPFCEINRSLPVQIPALRSLHPTPPAARCRRILSSGFRLERLQGNCRSENQRTVTNFLDI